MVSRWRCRRCCRPRITRTGLPGSVLTGRRCEGVLEKIAEEIQEVRDAANAEELAGELGDLIFSLVNLARWKKIDAELALRGTNMRFKQRFAYVEAGAKKQARNLSDLTIDEMEALWQEAKKANLSANPR